MPTPTTSRLLWMDSRDVTDVAQRSVNSNSQLDTRDHDICSSRRLYPRLRRLRLPQEQNALVSRICESVFVVAASSHGCSPNRAPRKHSKT